MPPLTAPATSIDAPLALLGGASPRQFVRRHWQKRPLRIRRAVAGPLALISRAELFALAGDEAVESRLVQRTDSAWSMRRGPLPRRALPPIGRPGWTLLVQGLDLHVPAARELLARFRFLPDARLDDLMLSWASDGGGVGPHVDSYDVFLLQVQGCRRWRVGPVDDPSIRPGLPLRILAHFEPREEWLLEPGDMLYLPPGWGHEGIAEGECMTASIGFRSPERSELAREMLARLADTEAAEGSSRVLYRDPAEQATATPARIPASLERFATEAVARALRERGALQAVLGEALTEPKRNTFFDATDTAPSIAAGLELDPRSRMMYDARHVFLNGESWRAGGRDARLLRRLADARRLSARELRSASGAALALLGQWVQEGWLHSSGPSQDEERAP